MIYLFITFVIVMYVFASYADSKISEAELETIKAKNSSDRLQKELEYIRPKYEHILNRTFELAIENNKGSVYYNKTNDTIVVRKDLEYIGQL